jgi:hypothetical protein
LLVDLARKTVGRAAVVRRRLPGVQPSCEWFGAQDIPLSRRPSIAPNAAT